MSQTIFSDGLGYEGKVTLTLKSNNRVLKSKTYKNKGTAFLFQFLGHCLIDSYEEVRNLVPAKLLLLQNAAEYVADARPTNVEQRSTWQTFAKMPTIISDSNAEQVKVVYSFEIPRAAIDENGFNQVALYGVGIEDFRDFSAFYYLLDDNRDEKLVTENVQNWSATTILLVEWELTLSNKNVAVNNN